MFLCSFFSPKTKTRYNSFFFFLPSWSSVRVVNCVNVTTTNAAAVFDVSVPKLFVGTKTQIMVYLAKFLVQWLSLQIQKICCTIFHSGLQMLQSGPKTEMVVI